MNNTALFTQKADDYFCFRPSYPAAAVQWLRERCGGEKVVDIGAGTGIFTRLLCEFFQNVSAVEPNGDMREKFKTFLPDVPCAAASAESTGIPDASVDLITAAQAFHWFDEDKFKKEAMRILRPGGKAAIVWNTSLNNDFTLERSSICRKYCPRFQKGYAGKRSPAEGDAFLREIYFRDVDIVSFDNPFVMDLECFEGNMRSRSYALLPGEEGYGAFTEELRALFERHAVNGKVTEVQETQIFLGSF